MHGWISGVLSIQGALIEIFSSSTTVVLVLVGVDDCPGLLQPLSGDFTSECWKSTLEVVLFAWVCLTFLRQYRYPFDMFSLVNG